MVAAKPGSVVVTTPSRMTAAELGEAERKAPSERASAMERSGNMIRNGVAFESFYPLKKAEGRRENEGKKMDMKGRVV